MKHHGISNTLEMDDDMMRLLIQGESPIQTDTIEGFLLPEANATKSPNITISSCFDVILNCWVPVCVSLLFGKSERDYKNHFNQVFLSFKCESFDEFKEIFPANTSNFSEAMRLEFFSALKDLSRTEWNLEIEDSQIIQFYKFCDVHFKRSMSLVTRNRSVVAESDARMFGERIAELLNYQNGQFFIF